MNTSHPYMLHVRYEHGPAEMVPYDGPVGREHVRAECRKILQGILGAPAVSVDIMRPAAGEWTVVEIIKA